VNVKDDAWCVGFLKGWMLMMMRKKGMLQISSRKPWLVFQQADVERRSIVQGSRMKAGSLK